MPFSSVQVKFPCVLLRLWVSFPSQPGVHCLWPMRGSVIRFLLRCRRVLRLHCPNVVTHLVLLERSPENHPTPSGPPDSSGGNTVWTSTARPQLCVHHCRRCERSE